MNIPTITTKHLDNRFSPAEAHLGEPQGAAAAGFQPGGVDAEDGAVSFAARAPCDARRAAGALHAGQPLAGVPGHGVRLHSIRSVRRVVTLRCASPLLDGMCSERLSIIAIATYLLAWTTLHQSSLQYRHWWSLLLATLLCNLVIIFALGV